MGAEIYRIIFGFGIEVILFFLGQQVGQMPNCLIVIGYIAGSLLIVWGISGLILNNKRNKKLAQAKEPDEVKLYTVNPNISKIEQKRTT